MIVKELDPFYGKNSWDNAGRKAEENTAFYLKRRFYDNKDLYIINNLRFKWLDSHVQIDHLILCKYGVIIIESKSFSKDVRYEGEQWFRYWDGHLKGMDNPVLQAKEQGIALKGLLRQNYTKLLGKFMFGTLQKGFGYLPIQCFVAYTGTGILTPPKKNDLYSEQVFRAEAIADKIEAYYKKLKHANSIFSKKYDPWDMSEEELQRVIEYLLSVHVPYTPEDALPEESEKESIENNLPCNVSQQPEYNRNEYFPPIAPSAPQPQPQQPVPPQPAPNPQVTQVNPAQDDQEILTYDYCPQCGSKISILWGAKFKSYYWHCESCGKNISINYKCPKCHEKLRIQKIGVDYYIYCIVCGLQEHYFTDK